MIWVTVEDIQQFLLHADYQSCINIKQQENILVLVAFQSRPNLLIGAKPLRPISTSLSNGNFESGGVSLQHVLWVMMKSAGVQGIVMCRTRERKVGGRERRKKRREKVKESERGAGEGQGPLSDPKPQSGHVYRVSQQTIQAATSRDGKQDLQDSVDLKCVQHAQTDVNFCRRSWETWINSSISSILDTLTNQSLIEGVSEDCQ